MVDMVTKSAFITLNQMVNLEDVRLVPKISECTRALLRLTDISRKLDKLVITGLLNKLAKFNPEFLAQVVQEDFVSDNQVLPVANLCAIAIAIVHDQGKNAPLLDKILNRPLAKVVAGVLWSLEKGARSPVFCDCHA